MDDDIYKYKYGNFCLSNCSKGTFWSEESKICLNITYVAEKSENNTNLYNIIKQHIFQIYDLDNNDTYIIKGNNNNIFNITNEKKEFELFQNIENIDNNYNLSIIDLSKCIAILRGKYQINENVDLIILKQEIIDCKSSEKNIQFEIFEPFYRTKLNLSFCSEDTYNIYVKTKLSEGIKNIYEEMKKKGYNIFNISDPFYQDICIKCKSINNTDIIISDRIKYIYYNEDSRCQSNCQFSGYLSNTQYINCSCNIEKKFR